MALSLAAPSPALAQASTPSTFERAMLAELDAPTRAEVERRAVAGNTVKGVIGTILLNNYYAAGARRPGRALTVVAIDFSLGVVVFRRAANVFEVQRFNPQTLRLLR
ncbi:MAG: hypothetical protein MT490_11685 [Sphingomonas sp.]|uniref:hypothetical protein n=1 Tax=Sphingomonas sp. TaxID=28214 RepID=UPI002274E39C|nr:hypothetical protein [Sphingomonas sp.]MCX8476447.1 hypothetical protein [Sphingomonas sp.]